VEKKNLVRSFTASGNIEASQKASLHFLTSGKVVWVGVEKGTDVSKGQALVSLDTTELQASFRQAEQDFIAAKAEVEKVYDETGRKTDESFSEKVKRTAAEAKQNKAYDSMKKIEKQMQDATLFSPISGVVTGILIKQGENVGITETIEIVNLLDFSFVARIDETDFAKVSIGQKAKIALDAYPRSSFEGKVSFISSTTEETESGGSAIRVEIKFRSDKYNLIDGLVGEAEFVESEIKDAVVVPRKSLIKEGRQNFIYVVKDGKREKRRVAIGTESEREIEIVSGISEGETIIVSESLDERQ
jgi:RND family efflux transporter MFP subunit